MSEEEKAELGPLQLIWYWLCEGIKAGLKAVGWAVVVLLAFAIAVFMVYYITNNACIQPVNPGDPLVCVFTDSNLWFTPK